MNTNNYNREKRDYYIRLPALSMNQKTKIQTNYTAYLSEERQNKQVSNEININMYIGAI